MFLESYMTPNKAGWVEVICGSMFSGKTEELIRRLNRAIIAKQAVCVFKPTIDVRYDKNKVVSHNQNAMNSITVSQAHQILELAKDYEVIGIDEAQFFDKELVKIVLELARNGKRVVLAGLDMDFEAKPFGVMPDLMALAEFVSKEHAICANCGGLASFSFRLSDSQETILLGEQQVYEPRCRACFEWGGNEQKKRRIARK